MATHDGGLGDMTEECPNCGRLTQHTVSVKILTESRKQTNAEFSREPYRVSECLDCGERIARRMNNA